MRGIVAAWAGALAVGFSATMGGFGDMMFNILEVPSLHAWKGPKLVILFKSGICLGQAAVYLLLWLLAFGFRAFSGKKANLRSIGETLREHRWLLFIFVAVTMIPGSLLGEVKIGGKDNSYHTLYYLMVGAGMAAYCWASQVTGELRRSALIGIYLLAGVLVGLRGMDLIDLMYARSLENSAQQQAHDFAKEHPGEVLFPWNPLATLYVDKKLYHFEYGVYDRVLAGFPPDEEHFAKHLPENLNYVIWQNQRESFRFRSVLRNSQRARTWKTFEARWMSAWNRRRWTQWNRRNSTNIRSEVGWC